jgi:hypothetical protein
MHEMLQAGTPTCRTFRTAIMNARLRLATCTTFRTAIMNARCRVATSTAFRHLHPLHPPTPHTMCQPTALPGCHIVRGGGGGPKLFPPLIYYILPDGEFELPKLKRTFMRRDRPQTRGQLNERNKRNPNERNKRWGPNLLIGTYQRAEERLTRTTRDKRATQRTQHTLGIELPQKR